VGHEPAGSRQARSKILACRKPPTPRALRQSLFEGAAKEVTILDEIIVKHAENWRFERLAASDRAILRLACTNSALPIRRQKSS